MAAVVLLGTLDTKPDEYAFLRDRVRGEGLDPILVHAGVLAGSPLADIDADAVAAAVGADRRSLAEIGDRGAAMATMAQGAAAIVRRLHAEGRLDGILGVGGSGGSSIVGAAMQALPLGVPKVLVSTMAAGDTRSFIGTSDITLVHSVADLAGLNSITREVLGQAAAAVVGMVRARAAATTEPGGSAPRPPAIAATMFGITTPAVTLARERLQARGYEVVTFHATGTGGRAMESLIRAGRFVGVLDVTTTELADELVGGVLSAGPDRLTAAGALGLPQVVSLGALDTANFGPIDTVPERFRERTLVRHNAAVTLMRTTPAECAALGRVLARKLNAATGPVSVFVPLGGLSSLDRPGRPFHDPTAGAALVQELEAGLRPDIEVVEMATDINDPAFAHAMAERLAELIGPAAPIRVAAAVGGGV